MSRPALTGDAVVDTQLAPLMRLLDRRGLVELVAVRPGELLAELDGSSGWTTLKAPEFTLGYWRRLCETLANWRNARFHEVEAPRLSTKLPGGHRFDALIGGTVESGVSVAIRVYREIPRELEADFGAPPDVAEEIRAAFRGRMNVLVSGGTSAGKTSLLNACLREVPRSERVLTVEDVRELRVEHLHNRVHFELDRRGEGHVTQSDVIDHLTRARPDRAMVGEVSMANALAVLLLLSTGHKGFAGSIHSNSCLEVVESAFPDRLALGGFKADRRDVADYLRRNLDLIVQVSREGGRKRITEIWWPGRQAAPISVGEPHE